MKKEENEEGQRKFWKQWSFGLWLITAGVIIVVVPLIVKVVLAKAMPEISGYGGVISAILLLVGLGFWLSKCFRQIGSVEVPSQAVLARFARPVDVVSTGLFFAFCPFEKFKEFPTGQSVMSYKIKEGLYSKEDKEAGLSSQPMKVEVSVYLRWPRVEKKYSFPMPDTEAKKEAQKILQEQGKDVTEEAIEGILENKGLTKGLEPGLVWGEVKGGELLMTHTYYRLPIRDLMTASIDELGEFFEGGVMSGVRHEMSIKTSKQCKEEQPEIEDKIKSYLLSEEGNPFFECGIPKQCLDIELVKVKITDEMEKAYMKPEKAKKDAEAAEHEKEATLQRIQAYIDKDVAPEVAGILASGGVEGEEMTLSQLRDAEWALSLRESRGKRKRR